MTKKKLRYNRRLFSRAPKFIGLDLGCGPFKQEPIYGMPFLGLDIDRHRGVDIVHDLQKFPWPIPSHSVQIVKASHVWEHIEPKYRFKFMDECWRICRPGGQLWLSAPHAGSHLEAAHPAHYMCPNQWTFQFFDPDYQLWHSCGCKKPLPWKIMRNDPNLGGCIELILEPRKKPNGRPDIVSKEPKKKDYVKIEGI
jgi:SAM-dependent methyltransferase